MTADFIIHFERSGGFTGMPLELEINSMSLPEDEIRKISDMIQYSGILNSTSGNFEKPGIPDQFEYEVTVESGGQRNTICFSDSFISEKLRDFISYLTKLAHVKRI